MFKLCPSLSRTCINLIEGDYDNQYTYQSSVFRVGIKEFALCIDNPELYFKVIAARMNDEVIERSLFINEEIYSILRSGIEICFVMKQPDLHYIILHTFD